MKYKNIFYFRYLNKCGGIESFYNYIATKYNDYDITVIYKEAEINQLIRLQDKVRCIRYTDQEIECDNAFFCFNREIWNKVKAKQKYIVLHGDYEDMVARGQLSKSNLPIEQDCKYLGVSQAICDSFERLTGIKCQNVGEPFIKPTQKKILKLCYCGRLAKEKGGERIKRLLNELDKQDIKYQMFVYSNGVIDKKDVIQLPVQLDVADYLNKQNYDYLLQLSDNEGYCYSVVEALSNGLPVITTPIPVFKEIGLNDSNSITMDFNCENINEVIYKMLNKTFSFEYKPLQDKWNSVLAKGQNTYRNERKEKMKVKLLTDASDTTTGKMIPAGTIMDVSNERGIKAISMGYAVEIAEVKPELPVENAEKPVKKVKKAVKKTTK